MPTRVAKQKKPADTKARLLDVAERLFSERGLGVSIREIVEAADTNVASVNYHFGSRDALVSAVVQRKWERMGEARRDALDALLERSPEPSARELLGTVLDAMDRFRAAEGESGQRWLELFSDLALTRSPVLAGQPALEDAPQWRSLLEAAVPDLPVEVLLTRMEFASDLLSTGTRQDPPAVFGGGPRLEGAARREELLRSASAILDTPD